jgi:hypothetical protein
MSNKCQSGSSDDKLFLAQVKKVGVAYSQNDAEFDTPFFDTMLANRFLVIPEEDELFFVDVPLASRWTIGQWMHIENVGKYPIVNIMGDHQVVVKNLAGVTANPSPGAQFLGSRKLWLSAEQTPLLSQSLTDVQAALEDPNFDPCLQLDFSSSADSANPVGALASNVVCQPCGDSSLSTKKTRCLRVFENILFKIYTIALPLIRSLSSNAVTFKKDGETVTESVQDIVWSPQDGSLFRRALPTTSSVDSYFDGKKTYVAVPSDYASKFYVLSPAKSNGAPSWRLFDFKASYRIGTSVVAGTVNVKTIVETALGISLPSSGEIDIGIAATTTQAAPGASVAQVNATASGITIASTKNQDNIANGYRVITINLSAPSIVFANGDFVVEVAYLPFSYYYQD